MPGTDGTPAPPFYESRRFKGAAAVVALLGAVWALLGAPTPWAIFDEVSSQELPASNTEIVLDASAAMADPFKGSATKFDAASDAVGQFVVPFRNEGLALRGFGGGCDEAGELLVDFGADHGDEVRAAVAGQQPGGDSNLANAVIAAIDDFADADRFPDLESPKRVVVFTGSVDDCLGEDAAGEIRREIERTGIDAVFKLVGVRVSLQDRAQLRSLAQVLGPEAEVVFADTDAEIAEVVDNLDKTAVVTEGGGGASKQASGKATAREARAEGPGDGAQADGFALNKRAFRLIQERRYEEAIPLLEAAVRLLEGDGAAQGSCDEDDAGDDRDTCHAYALFNLGQALRLAGRADEAIPVLERRLEIPLQTSLVRKELRAARAAEGS